MSNFKKTGVKSLLLTTLLCSGTSAFAQTVETSPEITDEVVATGTFIPNEKRITSEITSVLNEEAFETIGAGDIASNILTRVFG